MEKAKWNPLDVPRARQKGTESHSFLFLSQKGFHKTFRRALGSRRAKKVFKVSVRLT